MDDDDIFGTTDPDADAERPILALPRRAINSIEISLLAMQTEIAAGAQPPFHDDTESDLLPEYAHLFDGRVPTVAEVLELVDLQIAVALQPFNLTPHIELARLLGPNATQNDYDDACRAVGLEPYKDLLK